MPEIKFNFHACSFEAGDFPWDHWETVALKAGVPIEPNEHWPEGKRYDVYCLNGGAWDRPTAKGKYGTLEEAENRALELKKPAPSNKFLFE